MPVRALLLENLSPRATEILEASGIEVENHVAAMDEEHVGDMLANLVERFPDAVRERLGIIGVREGQSSAGKQHRRSFRHGRAAAGLRMCAQIVAAIDHRGGEGGRMVEARARRGAPAVAGLVHVE